MKISKPDVKKLKVKLWKLCREIIIQRYGNTCFTCGNYCDGSNRHVGHFIPSSTCGALLRYDLRNLRIQCYRCNIHGGGEGATYYKNLVEEKGQDYVDQIFKDKHKTVKADWVWFEEKISEYEDILKSL